MPRRGLAGLGVIAVALCCGFPLLLSAGVLGTLAGLGLGNWLIIGAGAAAITAGLWRAIRRRRPASNPFRELEETTR